MNPPAVSLAEARAALLPGEALLSIYTTRDRTFLWAMPRGGAVAFAVVPLGEQALAELVGRVRNALDPNVTAVSHIPEFDLSAAHEIYARLLEPVRAGWGRSRELLVVAHGPLARIPLSACQPGRPSSAKMRRLGSRATARLPGWRGHTPSPSCPR